MRAFNRCWITGMLGALALGAGLAAQAQWNPAATADLGVGMGSLALSQSVLSGTRTAGARDGAQRGPRELSPRMQRYCARWPNEGVCKRDRARRADALARPEGMARSSNRPEPAR